MRGLGPPGGYGRLAYHASDFLTTRPASAFGVAATSGGSANTYGSYANLLAATTEDTYELSLTASGISVSAATRNATMTIGIDYAGGTSYSDWLTDLGFMDAGTDVNDIVHYYFPLFIPAGASLGVKTAVSTASTASRHIAHAFGAPRDGASLRFCNRFKAFGNAAGASNGTSLTPGTASEGSWTQIGSATDVPLWWWQMCYSATDATWSDSMIHLDLAAGDASNKRIIKENFLLRANAAEQLSFGSRVGMECEVAPGELIYARAQHSGSLDTTVRVAVYGAG